MAPKNRETINGHLVIRNIFPARANAPIVRSAILTFIIDLQSRKRIDLRSKHKGKDNIDE